MNVPTPMRKAAYPLFLPAPFSSPLRRSTPNIRRETLANVAAIRKVNRLAFVTRLPTRVPCPHG